MSASLDGVNVNSVDSGELDDGAGDLGHKTLIENPDGRMNEVDGVRVLDEDGELKEDGSGLGEAGYIDDKGDESKSVAVEEVSGDDGMGMMNLVGRVLGGTYGGDNKVEDGNKSENRGVDGIQRVVAGVETSANGTTDINAAGGIGINGTVVEEKMDLSSSVLHKKLDSVINAPVPNGKSETKSVENADTNILMSQGYEKQNSTNNELMKDRKPETKEVDNAVTGALMIEEDGNQAALTNELVPDGKFQIAEVDNAEGNLMTAGDGKQEPIELVLDGKTEETDVLMREGHGIQRSIASEPVRDRKSEIEGADNAQDIDLTRKELISHELVPEEKSVTVEGDKLMDKGHVEQSAPEMNADYSVSDIVWGKVKCHPWWPGQIFAPSDASDKAIKYLKKDNYLIAYFGDRSFAWNEVSKIKPFHMNFSEMEKQSNTEGFLHAVSCAVDEVSRRVEVGLSCRCLPEEVCNKIKTQEILNSGIREESSRREVRDRLFTAASFVPEKLLEFVESLADVRGSKTDKLQFATMKAQLLAFNRWKGRYQLPSLIEFGELVEDGSQVVAKEESDSDGVLPAAKSAIEGPTKKRKVTARDVSSQKRNRPLVDEKLPGPKEKQISVLMSSSSPKSDGNKTMKKRGRKRKEEREPASAPRTNSGVGKRVCKALKSSENLQSPVISKSQGGETFSAKSFTPDEIFSKLSFAAVDSMQAYDILVPVVPVLREFRNSVCLEKPLAQSPRTQVGNEGRSKPETTDTFAFDGMEDSYWTDRFIQNSSQSTENVILDGDKEKDTVVAPSEEDSRATALILNFSDLESIPPVSNLNEIFRPFGPLKESETEILSKSKRAKVIFEKKEDAEAAFSSTGKYRTFGPSLVSYRLNYAPTPRKPSAASKRKKKTDP